MIKRYLTEQIVADLKEKIVLVSGPRQVGKTTLAQIIGKEHFKSFSYFNWDYQPDRKKIVNLELPAEAGLIIFDELHKYKNWKSYIKGIFDKYKGYFSLMVTGSAKMDIYRKGGDSLRGRYYHYRLHPLSLNEILGLTKKINVFSNLQFSFNKETKEVLDLLLKFGPFPEPFLKKDENHWRRWQGEKLDTLIREEIRDLTVIYDLSNLQVLVEILPKKVGAPLSVNNLREDLETTHKTLANYLKILELFYFHFRIYPYSKKISRALKKMAKLYLWDWSILENEGAKFENLIASHLLKFVDFFQDSQGQRINLHYLRDTQGREVDFLVTVDDKPWFAVETKAEDKNIANLLYFGERLKIPFLYQVVLESGIDYFKNGVRIISADKFLTSLI
jgi:predicted AAA+ superfamily ATPase